MLHESLFVYLYPLVSTLGFAGYVPQIKNLILAQKAPGTLSTTMWVFWLAEQFISAGYGIFHLKDFAFTFFSLLDLIFLMAVLALTLYAKHFRFSGQAAS